ncbi:MAG: TIGR03545 family protein, partial [Elusimicrobia bacterium]|nr:TIGR03545 family protein [Elusimicrobiota bacterium]
KFSIRGLRVADQADPMTNLFEFQKADFLFLPAQLLEKKVVVQEASVEGIAMATPRKTSGALEKKAGKEKEQKSQEPSAVSKKLGEMAGGSKEFGLARFEAMKGAGAAKLDAVKAENLTSLKVLDEGNNKVEALGAQWRDKIAALKTDAEIEGIKKDVEGLKGAGKADPLEAVKKLKRIKEIEGRIKQVQKNIKQTKESAGRDFDAVKRLLDEAKQAKVKDLASLKDLAGIPSFDAENIAQFLLGPVVKARAEKAFYWVELAKKYLPSKSGPAPKKEPEKARGVFIRFPKSAAYPAFLWKHSAVAGAMAAGPGELQFSGEVKDVSSEPGRWPEPIVAHVKGGSPAGSPLSTKGRAGENFEFKAVADRRREDHAQDGLTLAWRGYKLGRFELGNPEELGVVIDGAKADIALNVTRENERWQGKADIEINEAQLEPKTNLKGFAAEKVSAAVRSIKHFKVEVEFSGESDNLDFKMKSDIGKSIADSLKGALAGEVDKQKKALEDKVNGLYKDKAASLEKLISEKKLSALGPLAGKEGNLDNLLKEALGVSKGGSEASSPAPVPTNLKDLKKLFK